MRAERRRAARARTTALRGEDGRWRRRVRGGLLLVLAAGLGVGALVYALHGTDRAAVEAAMGRQPAAQLVLALALTAASFACLGAYDVVSVGLVARGRVGRRLALLAGASAGAVANTLGFHAVTGTAVRAHLYMPAGLAGADVARVVSLSWLSLLAGNVTLLAAAELVQATSGGQPLLHLAIGGALAAGLSVWLLWLAGGRREVAIRRFRLPLPGAALAATLMAIGAVESGTAIGALYVLLPADLTPPFSLFAAGCIAAVTLGAIAHTPGGIGVFEAAIVALLAARGRPDLLAALLLFRLIYNLLPFVLAVLVLGLRALRIRRRPASPR